ncbi:unnamed protein product [Calypogeia fissa]
MEDSVEERHDSVIGAVVFGIFNPTVDGEEDLGRIVGPFTKWRFTHNRGKQGEPIRRPRGLTGSTKRRKGEGPRNQVRKLRYGDTSEALLIIDGWAEGQQVRVVIDSGASDNFMSRALAIKLGLHLEVDPDLQLELPNGEIGTIEVLPRTVELQMGQQYKQFTEWKVVRLARYDMILGMPWLK